MEELWQNLQEEAVSKTSDGFRDKLLFPVKFEDRTAKEKLQSKILNGFLPLSLYGFALALWGIYLNPEASWIAYPLLFLLPVTLAWLVAPVFRFTSLKHVGDVVGLFNLGLLVPLIFALLESLVTPQFWRLSFASQAADAFSYYSLPTTILPFFVVYIGFTWILKYYIKREMSNSPWWEEPKVSLGRKTGIWILLLLPLACYAALLSASLPSQRVESFLAQPTRESEQYKAWFPTFNSANEEAWRSAANKTLGEDSWNLTNQSDSDLQAYAEAAVELLRERRLPPRGSYHMRYNHYDYLQISHRTTLDVELLTWSFADGLALGEKPEYNLGYRQLKERLENNTFSENQLLELRQRLTALKASLPPTEMVVEQTLRVSMSEYNDHHLGLGLLGWLNKRGLGPQSLANRAWLNQAAEQWLEVKDALAGQSLDELLEKDTIPTGLKPALEELNTSTHGLLKNFDRELNLPELAMQYEEVLDLLLTETETKVKTVRKP